MYNSIWSFETMIRNYLDWGMHQTERRFLWNFDFLNKYWNCSHLRFTEVFLQNIKTLRICATYFLIMVMRKSCIFLICCKKSSNFVIIVKKLLENCISLSSATNKMRSIFVDQQWNYAFFVNHLPETCEFRCSSVKYL